MHEEANGGGTAAAGRSFRITELKGRRELFSWMTVP